MSLRNSPAFATVATLIVLSLFAACGGGSQAPAESPEMTPSTSEPETTEPPAADAGAEEHVMPDGSVMSGDQHDEHGH